MKKEKRASLEHYKRVGEILANWNPIDVPSDIAFDEYQGYIPRVIRAGSSAEKIRSELLSILQGALGLEYDENNQMQSYEIEAIAQEIHQEINNQNEKPAA